MSEIKKNLSSAEKTPKLKSPKKKMRPGGGKAKGSSFEAKIAKMLSAALPINFIKSPGSGARIGGKNFATIGAMMGVDTQKLFNADVVPVNEQAVGQQFLFSIECKSYAVADNFTSLVSGSANVFKWFQESVVDSAKIDRKPILIFKWNHTPIFVAVSTDDWNEKHLSYIKPKLTLMRSDSPELLVLDIFELDELLKYPEFWVSPL